MNKRFKEFLLAPGKFLSDIFQYISWVKIVIFIMIIIIFANIGVFVYKHNTDYKIMESQAFNVDKIVNPYSGDMKNGTDALPFGSGMAERSMNDVKTQPDVDSVFESKISSKNTLDPIAKIKIVTSDASDGFFAGDTVFLSAIDSYDPDGTIKEYRWDFDQSNGLNIDATGVTSTVKYNTPGVYTITLTVIDEAGHEDFTSLSLTIQKAPEEKSNLLGISTSLVDFTNLDYVSRAEVTNSIDKSYSEFYMTATSAMAQAIYNSQAKTLPALPALSDIELSVNKDAKYALSIDSVIPRDGSTTYETKPIISATFYGSTATDVDSIELSVDGKSVTQYTSKMQYGINYTPNEDLSYGTHHATLIVANEDGYKTTKSWTFNIKNKQEDLDDSVKSYKDEQGPQLLLRVPDSNAKSVKPSTSIKLSYDEPVDIDSFQLAIINKETNISQIFTGTNVEWNVNNTSAKISSPTKNLFEYETSYQIVTRQKDDLGNESVQEWFITTEDYGAPTITINSPKNNSTVNKPEITVEGYADPTYIVLVDGVTATVNENGMFSATLSLEVGENDLEIISKDLNNKKDTQHLIITYDPKANDGNPIYVSQDTPIIMDASIRDGESVKEVRPQISFVYADSDDIDVNSVKLKIDDKDVTELSFITRDSLTYKPLKDLEQGKHTLELIVADTNGNTTKYDMEFTIDAYPESPEQLTAKLSNNNKNVLLMWDTVTNKNDPEYRVYRSTSSGVTATAAYEVARVSTTTWEDKEVIDGVTYYYIVAAVSADDIIGKPSNEVKIRVDSTPPDFQILKPQKNEETPYQTYTLEGKLNDSDVEKITVYLNNKLYGNPIPNDDGVFSIDLILEPGDNIIQTVVVDHDGNETVDIRLISYIPPDIDRPYAVYLSPKGTDVPVNSNIVIKYNEEMDFSRTKLWIKPVSNTDEVVPITANDITLTISDDLKTITYNPKDNLEFLTEYSVIVEAWDISGNLSLDDDWNFITAPKDAPKLEVTTPVEGTKFDNPNIFVSGITEPNITVSIEINGRRLAPDITSLDNGSFSKMITLDDYDNIVKIIATDKYNNTTTVVRNVYYDKPDTIPPTLNIYSPEMNSYVGEDHITVSGQTEVGSTVVITVNGKDQGNVIVDTDGKFSHKVELLPGVNEIIVKATDAAGNTTTQTIIVTYDAIGPIVAIQNPPDGYTTNQSRVEIRGMVEASDYQATTRLYLTVNSGSRIEITVLRDGGFNQFITLQKGVNIIKIYATDSYGNTNERSLNVYYDPEGTTGELVNSNTTSSTNTNNGRTTLFSTSSVKNNENQTSTPINKTNNNGIDVNTSSLINASLFANSGSSMATQNSYNYSNGNSGGTTDVVDPSTNERRYYGGDNSAPDLKVKSENGDKTTNKNNTISGTTEQEASVTVTQNGQNRYTGKADSNDGSFSTDVTLSEGHNIFTTTTTDASGNMTFNTQVVELDTTGPILNVFTPQYNAKIGTKKYLITGNTEPNSKVEIYVGGTLKATINASLTGQIQKEIDLVQGMDEGNTNIKIVSYDKMNNSTITTIPVQIDLTKPKIARLQIRDSFRTDSPFVIQNDVVQSFANNPGIIVGTSTPYAQGQTEPGAKVEMMVTGEVLGSSIADDEGKFSFRFGVTSDVPSLIYKMRVTDTFGNSSIYEMVLKVDDLAPEIRMIKPSGVMKSTVTNSVTADSNVSVGNISLNGQLITQVYPDDDGHVMFEVYDGSESIDFKILRNGEIIYTEENVQHTYSAEISNYFYIDRNIGTFGDGINKIEILVEDAAKNSSSVTISTIRLSNANKDIDKSADIERDNQDKDLRATVDVDPKPYENAAAQVGPFEAENYYDPNFINDYKNKMEEIKAKYDFDRNPNENPYGSDPSQYLTGTVKNAVCSSGVRGFYIRDAMAKKYVTHNIISTVASWLDKIPGLGNILPDDGDVSENITNNSLCS